MSTEDLQKFYEKDLARLEKEAAQQKAIQEANKTLYMKFTDHVPQTVIAGFALSFIICLLLYSPVLKKYHRLIQLAAFACIWISSSFILKMIWIAVRKH